MGEFESIESERLLVTNTNIQVASESPRGRGKINIEGGAISRATTAGEWNSKNNTLGFVTTCLDVWVRSVSAVSRPVPIPSIIVPVTRPFPLPPVPIAPAAAPVVIAAVAPVIVTLVPPPVVTVVAPAVVVIAPAAAPAAVAATATTVATTAAALPGLAANHQVDRGAPELCPVQTIHHRLRRTMQRGSP